MAEKPIVFSAPMVRALLAGRKTQTRRVAKFIPREPGINLQAPSLQPGAYFTGCPETGFVLRSMGGSCWNDRTFPLKPPYPIGTRLWVRETWRPWGWREDGPITIQYQADGAIGECDIDDEGWYERIATGATHECEAAGLPVDGEGAYCWEGTGRDCPLKWRPSIFLPREGSRITLEVTDVRVQRVAEISAADAIAEGMESCTPYDQFRALWDSINGKKNPWSSNPWVFAYTFKDAH